MAADSPPADRPAADEENEKTSQIASLSHLKLFLCSSADGFNWTKQPPARRDTTVNVSALVLSHNTSYQQAEAGVKHFSLRDK